MSDAPPSRPTLPPFTSPIRLGSALVSLVEPEAERVREFHRWYERDHFYAGVLAGHYCFAGRRWLAPRALRALRSGDGAGFASDPSRGTFLHTYWILDGHHEEFVDWAVDQVHALYAAERMSGRAKQIHTSFDRLVWSARRDPDGVPPELALDHPFAGLALVSVERDEDVPAEALERWHREAYLPGALPGSAAALCLSFEALPLPEAAPSNTPRRPPRGRDSLQLWFLERDPLQVWPDVAGAHAAALEAEGLGRVTFAAPFVPTVPGTDTHLDAL